jgi:hypothetical protein
MLIRRILFEGFTGKSRNSANILESQMRRKILLVEPNYKNKYPPIGLMKIATYHRLLGDKVEFFKGDLKDLVRDKLTNMCVKRLNRIDRKVNWIDSFATINEYIKKKKSDELESLIKKRPRKYAKVVGCLNMFSEIYRQVPKVG